MLDKLRKVRDSSNVLLEEYFRACTDALVRSAFVVSNALAGGCRDHCSGVLGSLRNLFPNQLLVAESLVVYAKVEQLVEVKVVLHQKANVAGLELHGLVAEDLRVRPHENVEGA